MELLLDIALIAIYLFVVAYFFALVFSFIVHNNEYISYYSKFFALCCFLLFIYYYLVYNILIWVLIGICIILLINSYVFYRKAKKDNGNSTINR